MAVSVVDEPLHIAILEPAPIEGKAFTVTVTVAVLSQPNELVPVTVYIVVVPGLAAMLEPVVADKPVDGDQE